MIEATFAAEPGQAFTDHPSVWSGTLVDMFALNLSSVRERAVHYLLLGKEQRREDAQR